MDLTLRLTENRPREARQIQAPRMCGTAGDSIIIGDLRRRDRVERGTVRKFRGVNEPGLTSKTRRVRLDLAPVTQGTGRAGLTREPCLDPGGNGTHVRTSRKLGLQNGHHLAHAAKPRGAR